MNDDDLKTNFKTWFPGLDPDTCDPSDTYKADVDDSHFLTSTSLPGVSMSGEKTNPGLGSTIENDSRDGAEDETEIFENSVPAEPEDDEAEPEAVYQLGKVLGRGGMGIVYQAKQVSLNRDVAVKCILPEKAGDERLRKKFTAEAQVVGLLDHPNIVPVHDLGKMAGDQILLAMKRVGGQEWSKIIHASHKLEQKKDKAALKETKVFDQIEHLKLLQSVCHAVAYAHSKGFVHLDLKPTNVMIGDFGEVYVMDWGVAAELMHGEGEEDRGYRAKPVNDIRGPIGTPQYMSSEQAFGLGRKIGTWTDVYLLGAILHEILTGRPPHLGTKFLQVILAAQKSETPQFGAGVPKELAELCIHALQKDIDQRIQSVDEFRGRLEEYLNHRESLAISRVSDDLLAHCRRSFEDMKVGADDGDRRLNEAERNQLYDDFSETVNGFRQAQTLWEQNKEAILGEKTTRLLYAEAALFHNDIGLAEAQSAALDRLGAPASELNGRIQQRKHQIERAEKNAQLTRYGLGLAAVLLTVVMTLAYFLVSDQKQAAERERDIARDEKTKADIARDKEKKARLEAEDARKESERQKTMAEAAQKKETAARLDSEKQRAEAELARAQAYLQYGNSLVAQGEALQLAKLDFAASRRYIRAAEIFKDIGQSPLPGEMPLWTLFRRSPPPILSHRTGNSPVYSLSVSPTGRFLALGTGRGAIQLWDLLKGQKLKEWGGHKGTIRSLEFSPNGAELVTGGIDDYVRCWTLKDQKLKWEFKGPQNEVVSIRYLGNGGRVLVAPGDNTPLVLNTKTGTLILKLEGHVSNVGGLAITKDSRICLTAGFDRTMRVWDLSTGKQLKSLRHTLALNSVAVSPNGLYGASAGGDFVLRIWDLARGEIVATLPGHRGKVGRLLFSPDGRFLLSGSRDGTSRLWDIENKTEVQSFSYSKEQVEAIAWVPNTNLFVSAGRDGFWHLWKTEDQTVVKEFPFRDRLSLGADVSSDNRLLVAGGVDLYGRSKQIVIKSFLQSPQKAWIGLRDQLADTKIKNQVSALAVWDIETKQLLHEFDNKTGKVMDLAFSADARKLVSGGLNTKIWDVEKGQVIKTLGEKDLIYNVEFGKEGKRVYTGGYYIRVWDWESGKMLQSLDGWIYSPRSLEFSPDNKYFAASSLVNGKVELREVMTNKLIMTYDTNETAMNRLSFSENGQWLAGGAVDGRIIVWNRKTGERKGWSGPTAIIMSLSISADGSLVVAGSRNGGLELFEVETGRKLCRIGDPKSTNMCVRFIKGQNQFVSCSAKAVVKIWNLDYLHDLDKYSPGRTSKTSAKDWSKTLANYFKFRGLWTWSRVLFEEDKGARADRDKLVQAQLEWAMGDLENARKTFVSLKDHTEFGFYARLCLRGFATTLRDRAFQRFQVKDMDGAYKDYSEAIKLAPEWGELWFWRGSVRAAQKKPKQAINNFKRSVKLGFATAQLYYRRGMAYLSMRDLRSAKADFDLAIEMNPRRVEPYIGRGTLFGMVRREDLAKRDYDKAIEVAPKNPLGYTYRGLSHDILGKREKAEADHNMAVRLNPNDEQSRLNRGFHFYKRNMYDKAIVDFNSILARNPRNSMVHALKGDCLYSKEDWPSALKSYNAAIFYRPQEARNYYSRGTVHRILKNYKQAVADYERYLASRPDPRRTGDVKEYLRWAKAKVSGKELGRDPLKKEASELEVKDRFLYAYSLSDAKKYDESDKVYQDLDGFIAKDDPRRTNMHYNWGCVLSLNKNADGAFKQLALSIAAGYKNKEHMGSDKDLIYLHKDPRWPKLLESIKP